jgi:DNA-binding CsgD family transcriptional regulator
MSGYTRDCFILDTPNWASCVVEWLVINIDVGLTNFEKKMTDLFTSAVDNQTISELAKRLGARPSEARVGLLVMQGLGNKDIARNLNLSESTVKGHVSSLLRLANLHNRVQLTNLLFEVNPGLPRYSKPKRNRISLII